MKLKLLLFSLTLVMTLIVLVAIGTLNRTYECLWLGFEIKQWHYFWLSILAFSILYLTKAQLDK